MAKSLQIFIDAGWYTVPLKGKLERDGQGKKSNPIFEANWKEKYTNEFNETDAKIGGVLTGKQSGIIAIDCDNDTTYRLFCALDPTYTEWHFRSKGKPNGGGTIIYSYDDRVGGFKIKDEVVELDFFSDEGFVYLPTEANTTKEEFNYDKLPDLKPAPDDVVSLLRAFKSKPVPSETAAPADSNKRSISNRLAPMLENLVKKKVYDPAVFKVITPHSFRELPSYVAKGHLHPNDVPKGRGSEYMSKVSAILGADISVNVELYTQVIGLINSLWDQPMDKNTLLTTIINPMVEERATIDGQVIWQYDPHWEKMGLIATALNGDYLESFYDDVKGLYYLINYSVPYIKSYNDKRPVISTLKALLGRTITETQYDSIKQLVRTTLNPAHEFGHTEGTDKFNLFRQSTELSVLNNPASYTQQYRRPSTIIKYFETLIPDDQMRMYILSFLRTKLTTFRYSPVVLYLIGKPGSGKDTLVNIIRNIIGPDYVAKPDTKVFLEQYNGWLMDKFVIQLDEYGNKLTRASDKEEALGKIKAYTGSSEVQIRAMRSDGFNYKHSATFILTANRNPLPVESDDRRFAFANTPHKLDTQDWVIEAGGIAYVQDLIKAEIMDFCFYLGTEIPLLSRDAYVMPPYTKDKDKLIINSLPAAEHILHLLQNGRYGDLKALGEEYGVAKFTEGWNRNRLMDEKLSDLYELMTEGHGSNRTVVNKLKDINIPRQHTTKHGSNVFFYHIEGLNKFFEEDAGFEKVEENYQPKGLE